MSRIAGLYANDAHFLHPVTLHDDLRTVVDENIGAHIFDSGDMEEIKRECAISLILGASDDPKHRLVEINSGYSVTAVYQTVRRQRGLDDLRQTPVFDAVLEVFLQRIPVMSHAEHSSAFNQTVE